MPTFQYRALTPVGEVVTGSLDATSLAEVNRRVEYLGLIPIEAASARNEAKFGRGALASLRLTGPRAEDVTIFTADLALLLHTGARINDALVPEEGRGRCIERTLGARQAACEVPLKNRTDRASDGAEN